MTAVITEGHRFDRKSLRVLHKDAGLKELAQYCVCFANAAGGEIHVGIEDGESAPPIDQVVTDDLINRIRKRVGEMTVNVQVAPEIRVAPNGAQYIAVVIPRAAGVASTSDGRYFQRVGDDCEGSGFDMMYDRLLASGRAAPTVTEGTDSVHVTVPRRIVRAEVIRLIGEADQRHHLSQRERIALGMLAQTEGLTASELAERLELVDPQSVRTWIDRLLQLDFVRATGRTKATRYFVPPELLRSAGLDDRTTLKRVEPYRLRALVVEDLERYPGSPISEIHRRIGSEVPERTLRRALDDLVQEGRVTRTGDRRWTRYAAAPSIPPERSGGR